MALGILIKTQRRIWFEVYLRLGALTKSQNKPAGLDSKRVVLRVFSLRKEPAFSVHSTAVLVGRANKPRWARAVKLRGFLFFSLLRRSFARAFRLSGAPDKTAMLHRLPTFRDVTNGFPAAQVTVNRSQV